MRVHALLIHDAYDSELLGIFVSPDAAKAAGERQFAVKPRTRWHDDGRGGQTRGLGSSGAYLSLRPFDVSEAV
jgi:hypothetical protein